MRFWERIKFRHISAACLKGSENVLGERNRIELEIGLKEEVDNIVDAPLS
jgi:hypothetical protein